MGEAVEFYADLVARVHAELADAVQRRARSTSRCRRAFCSIRRRISWKHLRALHRRGDALEVFGRHRAGVSPRAFARLADRGDQRTLQRHRAVAEDAGCSVAAVNQGGKRKGACCVYLETWHADIEEFLELRDNTGDEARRTHNLNLANWVPDLFMKRVESDDAMVALRSQDRARSSGPVRRGIRAAPTKLRRRRACGGR